MTGSYREGMVPAARWLVVAALALGVVIAPVLPDLLPVRESTIGAPALAAQVRRSPELGWSGEVRTLGTLRVPVSGSTFGGVARLLGEEAHLRVWWRAPDDWRIDRIRATGESDLVRNGGSTIRWTYEGNRVRFTPHSYVRLPDDSDLVPAGLAARLLSGARPEELSRLPARRITGRSAPGLRLRPADPRSTIARIDLWADDVTGLPLAVEVYDAPDATVPVLRTEVVALDPGAPAAGRTDFRLAATLDYSRGVSMDDVAGANAFAPLAPPSTVAGLARRGQEADFGAVGVYGQGATALVALPLRPSVVPGLREQLRRSRDSRESGAGTALEVGPISVLLVSHEVGSFLLAGTVTPATLQAASEDLRVGVVRTR